jgi:hypothetical protein
MYAGIYEIRRETVQSVACNGKDLAGFLEVKA